MNDPGQTAEIPISPCRRRAVFAFAVLLHVVVLAGGLFAWPGAGPSNDDNWILAIMLGEPAAVVSLASVGFAVTTSSLGTRLTLAVFTPVATWLVLALMFRRDAVVFDSPFAIMLAIILNTALLVQGAVMTLLLVRQRRWRDRKRHGADAKTGWQFGLRHIMLWTLLAAVVLTGLRAIGWDDWPDFIWFDTPEFLEAFVIYAAFGVIQAAIGLVTFACLGLRPSWRSVALATVMSIVLTVLLADAGALWFGTNDSDVWGIALITMAHFVLLSVSIGLLRLAGYRFTPGVARLGGSNHHRHRRHGQ